MPFADFQPSLRDKGDLNDLSSALVHYQKGLLITKKGRLGDLTSALSSYRTRLGIADKLTGRDPSNMEWRTDLMRSLSKVAGVLELQGTAQRAEAEVDYRRALELLQPLAAENSLTKEQRRLNSQLQTRLEELLKKNRSRENER